MGLAKQVRLKLEAEGKLNKAEPRSRPVRRQPKRVDFSGGQVLFAFRHGIGDHVQFSTVLRHLRTAHPGLSVDVKCRADARQIFVGMIRQGYTLEDDTSHADGWTLDVPWTETMDFPCGRAAAFLRAIGVEPRREWMRYHVHATDTAKTTARAFLRQLQPPGHWSKLPPQQTGPSRFRAALVQGAGATRKAEKDLSQDCVRAVCEELLRSKLTPIVIQWDDWHDLPRGCYSLRPDDTLWAGAPNASLLAAVAGMTTVNVGIDSGPGHIFGGVETPGVIAWTGHDPYDWYGLADHVIHAVPAATARGSDYRMAVCADVERELPEIVRATTGRKVWYRRRRALPPAPQKTATLTEPQRDGNRIFVSAGIGDWWTLESHFTPEERRRVEYVYLATRAAGVIEQLLPHSFPNFREAKRLWTRFGTGREPGVPFCFGDIPHFLRSCDAGYRAEDFAGVADWSNSATYPQIQSGLRKYTGSSYQRAKLADIEHLRLPRHYAAIHPLSDNDPNTQRDFNDEDWTAVGRYLDGNDLWGVVIGQGTRFIGYHHPRLINLTNQTTFGQAAEIVKGAFAFAGCGSCFSVVAATGLHTGRIFVKAHPELMEWAWFYYPAATGTMFLRPSLRDIAALRHR